MKNIFKSLVLALCLIPFTTAFAQLNPAHWNFNVKELDNLEIENFFKLGKTFKQ